MTKEMQKELRKTILPYEKSNMKGSFWQIVNTFVPFFSPMVSCLSKPISFLFLNFWIDVIAAGFVIRIFIIFHDCCHHSFFNNKNANEVLGTISGIITLFPFHQWRHSHNVHHATSGNLNKRGVWRHLGYDGKRI